ncbi:MAG: HAD-IIIC family phosphatase [Ignavibacteria bacterium]
MNIENLKYSDILLQNKSLMGIKTEISYKISVLANVTVNPIKEMLELLLRNNQIKPDIEIGNYDNIIQDSINYKNANLVIVFLDLYKIVESFQTFFEDLTDERYEELNRSVTNEIELIINNLRDCPAVVFNTFTSSYFTSNYTQKSRKDIFADELNRYLIQNIIPNVTTIDIGKIITQIGKDKSVDLKLYNLTKTLYTISFLKNYVSAIEPIILGNTGKLKKAIVFDCDNTLWKGILGEDGMEKIDMSSVSANGKYFNTVQKIALYLSKKGIIVGLCSKNNEEDVREVLLHHKDLVLKEEHIVIQKINWVDKATNLKSIAKELNIGLDSIVFVDDSPFEISLINEQLPEILTLQVPKTLYEYPDFMLKNVYKYFNLKLNDDDTQKTQIYKQQYQREKEKENFENIEDYLRTLKICINAYKDNKDFIPRISQLTQKTNQFNLTTRRYTENQINQFIKSDNYYVFCASVSDKFGENGITTLCILKNITDDKKTVSIDTLLMSCRIIGRNIEYKFFEFLVDWLKNNNVSNINSEYIPTKKNIQVEKFYDDLGFELIKEDNERKEYMLRLKEFKSRNTDYIKLTY